MKKLSITIFVTLLLVSSIVSAAFTLDTEVKSQSLCPRDTGLYTNIVTNDGTDTLEFTVNHQGAAQAWATTNPNGFILLGGESRTIYTYVTPYLDTSPGNYNLDVVVSTKDKSTKLDYTVKVKDCYGTGLKAKTPTQTSCPDEITKYDFTVKNEGVNTEVYKFYVNGPLSSEVSLSKEDVTLTPGKSTTLVAYVNVPSESGTYGYSVIAESQSNKHHTTQDAVLEVDPCFEFNAEANQNLQNFCEASTKTVPIIIRNEGTSQNEFNLKVDGPKWAKLNKRNVVLGPNQKTTVNLVMNPDYGNDGNYKIDVEVIPKLGNLKAVNEFDVTVNNCHSVAVDILDKTSNICNGFENGYEVLITNDGDVTKDYKLSLEGPDWTGLEQTGTITLKSGDSKTVMLKATPGYEVPPKSYKATVKTIATDNNKVTATAEDTINLKTYDLESCYKVDLKTKYNEVGVYYDGSLTVPLEITNKGITKGDYEVILSGTAANFAQISPGAVIVDSDKSKVVYLYIAPTEEIALGNYEATIGIRVSDSKFLDEEKILLRVTNDKTKVTDIKETRDLKSLTDIQKSQDSLWNKIKAWFTTKKYNSQEKVVNESTEESVTNEEAIKEETVVEETSTVDPIVSEGIINDGNVSLKEITGEVTTEENYLEQYQYYLLWAIIALLVILILHKLGFWKGVANFFSEEIEEEEI